MKRKHIILIISILIIGIIILILFERRKINKFEFPDTIKVENFSNNRLADTLSMVILNKIMGYDTVNIKIYTKPPHIQYEEIDIVGLVERNFFEENSFIIYVEDDIGFNELKRFISHEMIHIDQILRGDLITFFSNYDYYIFEGDTIYLKKIKYEDRPFELEAYKKENDILKKLNKLLYR